LPVVDDSRVGLNLFMLRMVELEDTLERADYVRTAYERTSQVGRFMIQSHPHMGFDGFKVPRSCVAYLQCIAKAIQVRAESLRTPDQTAEAEFLRKHDFIGLLKRMVELRPR
jgi:hypothetical protein